MNEGIQYTGIPSRAELEASFGIPSQARMKQSRVACIECVQPIPCNPCEGVCPRGAITVGDDITALPRLNEALCVGCGLCVANCPGLAITMLDKSFSDTEGTVDFPFEYLPLPAQGDTVQAVGRDGAVLCDGVVEKITRLPAYAGTTVIRLRVPLEFVDDVRSMKRLKPGEGAQHGE